MVIPWHRSMATNPGSTVEPCVSLGRLPLVTKPPDIPYPFQPLSPRPHLACIHGVCVFHRLQAFRLRIIDLTFQAFYLKSEHTSLATTHQLSQAVSFKHKQDGDSCQREDTVKSQRAHVHSLERSRAHGLLSGRQLLPQRPSPLEGLI